MDVQKRRTELGRIRKKKHRHVLRRNARIQKQLHCDVVERMDPFVARYTTTTKILPLATKYECENAMYLNMARDTLLNDYEILDYTSVLVDEYDIVDAAQ